MNAMFPNGLIQAICANPNMSIQEQSSLAISYQIPIQMIGTIIQVTKQQLQQRASPPKYIPQGPQNVVMTPTQVAPVVAKQISPVQVVAEPLIVNPPVKLTKRKQDKISTGTPMTGKVKPVKKKKVEEEEVEWIDEDEEESDNDDWVEEVDEKPKKVSKRTPTRRQQIKQLEAKEVETFVEEVEEVESEVEFVPEVVVEKPKKPGRKAGEKTSQTHSNKKRPALSKIRMPELTEICRNLGLKVSGKRKCDYTDAICNYWQVQDEMEAWGVGVDILELDSGPHILCNVASYLPIDSIGLLCRVSKSWNGFFMKGAQDLPADVIWKCATLSLLNQAGQVIPKSIGKMTWRDYAISLIGFKCGYITTRIVGKQHYWTQGQLAAENLAYQR